MSQVSGTEPDSRKKEEKQWWALCISSPGDGARGSPASTIRCPHVQGQSGFWRQVTITASAPYTPLCSVLVWKVGITVALSADRGVGVTVAVSHKEGGAVCNQRPQNHNDDCEEAPCRCFFWSDFQKLSLYLQTGKTKVTPSPVHLHGKVYISKPCGPQVSVETSRPCQVAQKQPKTARK